MLDGASVLVTVALDQILETVVTFHVSGGKVYALKKGCHTCMIKHACAITALATIPYLAICVYIQA